LKKIPELKRAPKKSNVINFSSSDTEDMHDDEWERLREAGIMMKRPKKRKRLTLAESDKMDIMDDLSATRKEYRARRDEHDKERREWNDAKYEKGEIRAVAYKNGKKWAETVRRTAESVVSVKIEEEKSSSGDNLVFYKISLVDKFGTVVPNDDKWLTFSVENGTLAGVCNGDAFDMTGLVQPKQKTFRGLCQAIVRRTPGAKVKLHAVLQK
jgi:hypothetical protein